MDYDEKITAKSNGELHSEFPERTGASLYTHFLYENTRKFFPLLNMIKYLILSSIFCR